MAKEKDPRRAHQRRRIPNVEMYCYRASPSVLPQMRRNIGREIVDISHGGARLRVSESVNRGDTITLELRDRHSGEAFRARGEVRWTVTAGPNHFLGVQFQEHYTPVGLREHFTGASENGSDGKSGNGDILLKPDGDAGGDVVLRPPEKRRSDRFPVDDCTVTVLRQGTLASQGLKKNLARKILDLSPSGAQVQTVETLEPGALVQFTLQMSTLPDTLDVLGAVRWSRPDAQVAGTSYRAGVQFLNVGDPQRKMIDFLRKWFGKGKRK